MGADAADPQPQPPPPQCAPPPEHLQRVFLWTPEKKARLQRRDGVDGSLFTNDIPGAQSGTTRVARRTRLRQRQTMCTADIPGARPRVTVPQTVNRVNNLSLYVRDIAGAAPLKPWTTERLVNPLCPEYNLPSCAVSVPEPPKQTRQTNECRDICGAPLESKSWFRYPKPAETAARSIDYRDVEGSTTGWKAAHQKRHTPGLQLEVREINNAGRVKYGFCSGRRTEGGPLSPRYIYDIPAELRGDEAAAKAWVKSAGAVRGNHSRRLTREVTTFALHCRDIDGNAPDDPWRPAGFPKKRRQMKRTNYTADIRGTHHAVNLTTFYKQRRKGRGTNPLNPRYAPCKGWADDAANPFNETSTPVRREAPPATCPAAEQPPAADAACGMELPTAAGTAAQAARRLSQGKAPTQGWEQQPAAPLLTPPAAEGRARRGSDPPLGGSDGRPRSARAWGGGEAAGAAASAIQQAPPGGSSRSPVAVPPPRARPKSARPGGRVQAEREAAELRQEIESVRSLGKFV